MLSPFMFQLIFSILPHIHILEAFEMWIWKRMESISWLDKATKEEVLTRVNEKALGEMQILRTGRSNAGPKNFRPAADPLPGGAGPPKFNQLEMVATCT